MQIKKTFLLIGFISLYIFAAAQLPAIKIDDDIKDSLWQQSRSYAMENGGKVLMKVKDGLLYIGIEGKGAGLAHVYIKKADTIFVHHASASLGTAVYMKDGNEWKLAQPFDWKLRGIKKNDLAQAQIDHLKQYGWVASTNNSGNGSRNLYLT
jgi:hypothetical protein